MLPEAAGPKAAFSRPRSQFFTIRTDPKPANNRSIFFPAVNSRVSYSRLPWAEQRT